MPYVDLRTTVQYFDLCLRTPSKIPWDSILTGNQIIENRRNNSGFTLNTVYIFMRSDNLLSANVQLNFVDKWIFKYDYPTSDILITKTNIFIALLAKKKINL